jgi:hypothetical protein
MREKVEVAQPVLIQSLLHNLTQFELKLSTLNRSGRLIRFFTNKRLRRHLDYLNSDIGLQIGELEKNLSNQAKTLFHQTVKGQHTKMVQANQDKILPGVPANQKQEVEDRFKQFGLIWKELFGEEVRSFLI